VVYAAASGGGLAAGILIFWWVPEAKGPGVPEVIASVASRQSIIRHRVTFLKALVTSLLIGSGASVGREGPIVQIGASAGSSLAQVFRLDPDLRRVCLAAGAAAGIAATFNAPITGTLFAIEIILFDIEVAYISHIIAASVIASVLSRFFWGDFPVFSLPGFHLKHYWELFWYLLLGIAAGLTSIAFSGLVSGLTRLFDTIRLPEWVKPGIGGTLLGLLALMLPQVLGVGYDTVNASLAGGIGLEMALILLAGKMLATACCIGSGMSGGIFAPSLYLGATLGLAAGKGIALLLPSAEIVSAHYALAGMGAVVAGTTLAPITAILTIFELSNNYETILPLMVASIASATVVRRLYGYSVYEKKLIKQGINIVRGHDVSVLRSLIVRDFMQNRFESLYDYEPLSGILVKMEQSGYPHYVVKNRNEELVGVLSLRDLQGTLARFEDLKDIVLAADIMTRNVVTITLADSLEKALIIFEKNRISFIPVTRVTMLGEVVGVLKKDDLLQAYRERVLKDRILSSPVRRKSRPARAIR
jgi:CIC family chloride channel protein